MGSLGAVLGCPKAIVSGLGALLGCSWVVLEASWAIWRRSRVLVERSRERPPPPRAENWPRAPGTKFGVQGGGPICHSVPGEAGGPNTPTLYILSATALAAVGVSRALSLLAKQ